MDDGDIGDALLVVGYATAGDHPDDARLPLVTRLGEALLASASPWRVRRLAANAGDRDAPTRFNLRRALDKVLGQRASARLVVLAAELTRTVEGLAIVCAPTLGEFREDATVSLDWVAQRLRRASAVPTAILLIATGQPRDAQLCLDLVGTAAAEHVIVVHTGAAVTALHTAIDALWSEAVDLGTGTVTPRSLGDYLQRRLEGAAIQPSASSRTLLAPHGLARSDLAERMRERDDDGIDEPIGAVLPGHFRVVAELGRGRFGVVYRAHQELVDREVAIKVLQARLGVSATRQFAHEIRAIGRFDHPNVVRVYHADVTRDGRMFVAMELLAGTTLEAMLAAGPMRPARALGLIRQLVAGLAAAHAAGIVHGDIAPANVIVVDGRPPRLVLLDFGLSRLRNGEAIRGLGGTPAFMAPEQRDGGHVDASADLYAAAMLSLALIHGGVPDTDAARARALEAFGDSQIQAALTRALAPDPSQRYPSAVELAAALGDTAGIATRPERPPFRLAAAFTEEDHHEFYGRGRDIERLLEDVLFRRAVVYVAPSGSGKTSLLRAGLAPRLQRLGIDVCYLACLAGTSSDLVSAIAPGAASVAAAIAQRTAAAETQRLVVIIDQVEAALIHGQDSAEVLEALELPSWPKDARATVIWSVREEYLARLLYRTQRLEPGLPIVRLGPLAPTVAADIFQRTLERRGVEVEPALLETLIHDLTRAAASLAVELGWRDGYAVYPPHLQLAGKVLYDARHGSVIDLALYREVGGLAAILAEHLHRVLEGELGSADMAIARDVLLALVTASHTHVACEHAELVARLLAEDPTRTASAIASVLEFLRDRGLLVTATGRGGDPIWDLAHDSLVAPIEAWVTATDLARRRAMELVRYHLRRSTPRTPSRLGAAELREVREHLAERDLAELDVEWRARLDDGPEPASDLVTASRRAVMGWRLALSAFSLIAIATSGVFAQRWMDGRREITLRDRDIGATSLILRAFDWDPVTLTARDVPAAELAWRLVRPQPSNEDAPGAPFAAEDLSSRRVAPPVGAVRMDEIAVRGGPAVLLIDRHDRGGRACTPVIVPIRRLAGYGRAEVLALRIPTCEASLAATLPVPGGPYIASGPGEPPSSEQVRYNQRERTVVVPAYRLDRTELSNAALVAVADALIAGGRNLPIYPDSQELEHAGAPDRPVSSMTWFDATVVCGLFGKRLPSSAEWQKALRGGDPLTDGPVPNPHPRRNLPWGPRVDSTLTNVNANGHLAPAPVGSFVGDVGPYGHVDLAGNVTEWTADRRPDGFAVMRGGNWADTTADTLVDYGAIENPRQPKASMYTFGFRCAMSMQ